MLRKAFENGTPLPKGHGRIIDESKIKVCEWVDVWEEDYPKASTDAPTIIEADGGVLEKIAETQNSLKSTCKAWDEAIEKDGYVN